MDQITIRVVSIVCASLCLGLVATFTAIAQGRATCSALEAVARQPEAKGTITQLLIVGLAIIESLALYALLVAIILIFVNPFVS